jgi:putative acetyltransferase
MMVRRYSPKDLPAMLALFGRSVRELASRDYAPEQLAAWAPELPDVDGWSKRLSNQMVFVCENQGEIAGFVSVESDGHLDLLYVHPEAQRRGVASVLWGRILEWATASKLTNVSTEASITARPFFEHCGFRVVRSQTVQARGVSMSNFRMERAL